MLRTHPTRSRLSVAARRAAAGALAALLLSPPAGLLAQGQELEGLEIRAIEVEGLRSLPRETVLFYLGVEEGGALDLDRLNENLHRLWSRELVDDVDIEAEPLEGGVLLRVRIRERPVLRSVEYEGLKRVSRGEVSERIARDGIGVREGSPLDRGELRRLEATIEEMYREQGYRFADARYTLEEVERGEQRVLFTIDEGDKVRIAEVEFDGNAVFGELRLQWAMKKTKETNLLNRILKKDVFNPAHLEEDLENIRRVYREAGYKNVAIGEPELDVQARGKKRRLVLTIPIAEGERWKLGEITIEGNEKFADQGLLRQFKRPRGGWLRSKVIDDGVEAINDLYRNTGHLFAEIDTELRERQGQVADLVVHVREGDQFRVGRIEFQGNTRTRDKVLRRELRVQEGLVMNVGALRNSLRKIGQLEYFKVDEEDPVAIDFNTEEQTVDLTVKGEEGDRTELMLGGGWSELDGFFGQFSLRTRNFMGRGETVGVAYQSGRFRDMFDLSYFAPWFLDRPQSIGVQAFRRNLDYTLLAGQTFIQKTQGGVLTYGRNLGLFNSLALSYSRFDAEDRRRLINPLTGELIDQEVTRDISSLRPVYVRDTRDSRLQPTSGLRLSGGVEYAGGVLGGTTNFYRPEISFSLFRPVTRAPLRTVWAVNLESGLIEPFDDQELFFLDRYYLGGENSLRGFRFRSVWVRCEGGEIIPGRTEPCAPDDTFPDPFGFPLGGDRFVQANVEYHFLLGGPFRIILFADAGNVYDGSYDLSRLRYTSGLELRVFVPVFGAPLRFIYARNLDPLPDDRFENFQFSIGTSF